MLGWNVVCSGCDYSASDSDAFRFITIRYKLPSGETFTAQATKGWCYDCPGYRTIEALDFDQERLAGRIEAAQLKKRKAQDRIAELDRLAETEAGKKQLAELDRSLDAAIGGEPFEGKGLELISALNRIIDDTRLDYPAEEGGAGEHPEDEDGGSFPGLGGVIEYGKLGEKIDELEEDVADLSGMLRLAKTRKAGARCLKCWSDRTEPALVLGPMGDFIRFQHECGGRLHRVQDEKYRNSTFICVQYAHPTYVLNEEGELIEEIPG